MENEKAIHKKLDAAIDLLQILVAIELFRSGVSRIQISKRLKMRTGTLVHVLKGLKRIEVKRNTDE
jgi:hypothetical protein